MVVHRAMFGAHGVPTQCASVFLVLGESDGPDEKNYLHHSHRSQAHHRPSRGHGGYAGLPSVAFYAPAVLLGSFLMHMIPVMVP